MTHSKDDLERMVNYFGKEPEKFMLTDGPKVVDMDDIYLTLADVRVYNAHGDVKEDYPELKIARHVRHDALGKPHSMSFQSAVQDIGLGGGFMPSMGLTCNVLVALYDHMMYSPGWTETSIAAENILQQYFLVNGLSTVTNTIFDINKMELVDYPNGKDVGLMSDINMDKKKKKSQIESLDLQARPMHENLDNKNYMWVVKNFTGLKNPSKLDDVSMNYDKRIHISFTGNALVPIEQGAPQVAIGFGQIKSIENCVYLGTFSNQDMYARAIKPI